jgi:ribosomal-protein-alanine N-acetyltransferase
LSRRPIEIRLVRPAEHVELRDVRLSALASSPHLAEHLAKESAAPSDFWRGRADERAKAIDSVTFVAVDDGTFVGVADGFLSHDGRTVEIGGMWVSPALRRSGIGSDLLAAACDWARKRGAGRAGLWVRMDNDPARSLYEGAGFDVTVTSSRPGPAGLRLERLL